MNNEKLKIAICGYLPYGLKVSCENTLGKNEPHQLLSIERDKLTIRKKSFPYRTYVKLSEGLPYLFPISSLTKPLQLADYNNGEPFVPAEEIARQWMQINGEILNITIRLNFTWRVKFEIMNKQGELVEEREMGVLNMPFWIIDLLNRWKIDYRGLINEGLAIEVNEENNPYL